MRTELTTAMTFRLNDDERAALNAIRDRDGVLVSEQIRRAIRLWIEAKGITNGGNGNGPHAPARRRPARRR